jgi:hypothetical protein
MAKRRGRVKRGGGWRQDNRLNCSGWSRGALAKPWFAPRQPSKLQVRKDSNTEDAGRATEGHGAEQKSHFARSPFDYFLRGPPWPSLRPPC